MNSIACFLICALMVFGSCNSAQEEIQTTVAVSDQSKLDQSSVSPAGQLMMDSLELCYDLIKEKSLADFVRNQPPIFTMTDDTVINDERGLSIGKRLSVGNSFIQWLDDSTVTKLSIDDARIKLNCGIRVGMSKEECRIKFKLGKADFDTLSFGYGFLDNGKDLYFKDGYLRRIEMLNMPD